MVVYDTNSRGLHQLEEYEGWGQLHDLKAWAMNHLPSDVVKLLFLFQGFKLLLYIFVQFIR